MRIKICITLLLLAFASTTVFGITYQTTDISTGINVGSIGNPVYSAGQTDGYWKVAVTPNGTNLGGAKIPNLTLYPYVAWGVIPGTNYIFSNQTLAGKYEYERCFCLDNPEKARLSLELRADNMAEVFLNQYSNGVLNVTANDSFRKDRQPVKAETVKGFQVGVNCLRIRVNNEGSITGTDAKVTVSGFGVREVVENCCRVEKKTFQK